METAVVVPNATDSLEAVYRHDSDRLWRAVYAYAGDADIATDAVAEAYAQAIRRGAAVRDPAAWVWRTAFRIAAGALKTRRSREKSGDARPATHLDRYEDTDLRIALSNLPDGQRAAIVLFYYADLPVREIAARLGSNALAVRANLSRGRRRLHQLLGEEHG